MSPRAYRGRSRALAALAAVASLSALLGGATEASAGEPATVAPPVKTLDPRPTTTPSRASTEIAFAQLPQGQVLEQDWTGRPAAIPAGPANLPGVRIKRVVNRYRSTSQLVYELNDGDLPAEMNVVNDDVSMTARCFDAASEDPHTPGAHRGKRRKHPVSRAEEDASAREPVRWSPGMSAQTEVRRTPMGNGTPPRDDRVQMVHVEELVTTAQGTSLLSRDVWVDATTGGVRLRATASLPLLDLGASPVGLHLYAGRAADQVVFVARHLQGTNSLFGSRKDDGGQMGNCGHLAMRLDVKRGMSEMGMFQTLTKMPDEEKTAAAPARAKTSDESDETPSTTAQTTTRTRLGRIIVSSTWETSEPAPLLALSGGWADRVRTE